MKTKLLLSVTLLYLAICSATAQERMISMGDSLPQIPYSEFVNSDITIMDITTIDGEMPTCDYIKPPYGAWGKTIANATRVPGRMRITRGNATLFDTGEYIADISGMTIRIRGNSSAYSEPKPYKIDLQQKADLLMRNNPKYADKDWVLIRDLFNYTFVGFEVSKLFNMPWTPGYSYITLILNDQYQGVYVLAESVKRNTNCRINISKQGFLFEYDAYWWTKDFSVPSKLFSVMRYTVKYPDPLTQADKDFFTQLVTDYENGIPTGTYDQYIDVITMAKWTLAIDFLGLEDTAGINRFLTLYDRNSLIQAPTLWDFGSLLGCGERWAGPHRLLMKQLFNSPNPAFKKAFVEEWFSISNSIITNLHIVNNRFKNSDMGLMLQRASEYERLRWNHTLNPRISINEAIAWLTERKEWIDQHINEFYITGDSNLDYVLDVADVNAMINMALGMQPAKLELADMNADRKIDVEDVNLLMNKILKIN